MFRRGKRAAYQFCEACKAEHPAGYVTTFPSGNSFIVCEQAAAESTDCGAIVRPVTDND